MNYYAEQKIYNYAKQEAYRHYTHSSLSITHSIRSNAAHG